MMNNWEMASNATQTALNSEGSAMRENAKYMESMEARVNKLKNAFTEFSLSVGGAVLNNAILGTLDALTSLANGAVKVIDTVGALPPLLAVLGAALVRFGTFSKIGDMIGKSFENIQGKSFKEAFSFNSDGITKTRDAIKGLGESAKSFPTTIANTMHGYSQAVEKARDASGKAAPAMQKLSLMGKQIETNFPVASTAIKGFGVALTSTIRMVGSLAVQMAVFAAIGWAIEKLIAKYQEKKRAEEEALKLSKTMVESYTNNANGLEELADRYDTLNNKFANATEAQKNTDEYEEYLQVQKELAEALPSTVAYVDELGNAHIESSKAVRDAIDVARELSELQSDATIEGYNSKLKEQKKTLKDLAAEYRDAKLLQDVFDKAENSNDKAKALSDELQLRQQISSQIQDTISMMNEMTEATLIQNKQYQYLTDSQKAIYENMNQGVKGKLNEIMLSTDYDSEKEKIEAYYAAEAKQREKSIAVAEKFASQQKKMQKEIRDDSELTRREQNLAIKEMETNVDSMLNLFNSSDIDDGMYEKLADNLDVILEKRNELSTGELDYGGFRDYLIGLGMESDVAKDAVGRIGASLGNFLVVAEATEDGVEDLSQSMVNLKDNALDAMDAMTEMSGISGGNVDAMKSWVDVIDTSVKRWGDEWLGTADHTEVIDKFGEAFNTTNENIIMSYGHVKTFINLQDNLKNGTNELTQAQTDLQSKLKGISDINFMNDTEAFQLYLTTVLNGTMTYQELIATLKEQTLGVGEADNASADKSVKANKKREESIIKVGQKIDEVNEKEVNPKVNESSTTSFKTAEENASNLGTELNELNGIELKPVIPTFDGSQVDGKVDATKGKVKELDETTAEPKADLDDAPLNTKVVEVNKKLNEINNIKLNPLSMALDETGVNNAITGITTRITNVADAVSKINEHLNGINASGLLALEQPITNIGTKIDGVMGKVSTLSQELGNISSKAGTISVITTNISNLALGMLRARDAGQQLNDKISSMSDLTGKVAGISSSVTSLTLSINTVSSSVANAVSRMGQSFDSLKNKVKSAVSGIASAFGGLASTVAGHTGTMNSLHSSQASALSKVRSNATLAKDAVNRLNSTIDGSISKLDSYIRKANNARQAGSNLPSVPSAGTLNPTSRFGVNMVAPIGESFSALSVASSTFSVSSEGASSFGGGEGSSGIIRPSINTFGNHTFTSLADKTSTSKADDVSSEMPELYEIDKYDRAMKKLENSISIIEAKMKGIAEHSQSYRTSIKKVIREEEKRLKLMKDELASEKTQLAQIEKKLKKLSNTTKHTKEQREEYNKLQQDYDSGLSKVQSLSVEIENLAIEMKEKSKEIFTNMIEEVVKAYDRTIATIQDKIDNVDFRLSVAEITDEDNLEMQGKLLSEKLVYLQKLQTEQATKLVDLERRKHEAVIKYGSLSDTAQDLKEQIRSATSTYESTVLDILNTQKNIKNLRGTFADNAIDSMKNYYKQMQKIETDSFETSLKSFKKAHEDKMDMYDDEIEKIKEIYDARIKAIDDEADEEDYQEQIDELTKEKNEVLDKIALLSRNNDPASKKRLKELNDDLLETQKELDNLQKDRYRDKLKEELEAQRDAQIEALESKRDAEDEAYDIQVESLEAQRDAINDHYENILNDETRWSNLRAELLKGNFSVLEGELTTLQNAIGGLNSDLFASMKSDFESYLQTVRAGMQELGLATNSVGSGSTFNEATKSPSSVAKGSQSAHGKLTTGVFTTKDSAQSVASVMEQSYQAIKADVQKDANGWRVIGEFNDVARATKVLADMKKKKTLPFGYISSFDTGGYTGEWGNTNGKLALLHEKELILNKDDTSNVLNVVKLVREIAGLQPQLMRNNINGLQGSTSSDAQVVNEYNLVMHVDTFSGSKKDSESALKLLKKGMKKMGG